MSLQSSLGTAVSGLRSSQLGIDLVARNIANADTDGYTRKVQRPVTQYSGGQAFGVRAAFSSTERGAESVAGDLVPGLFVEGGRPAAAVRADGVSAPAGVSGAA